ncbi:MAG: S8 family serine peptidase, partial [Bacteroidota bacterium]
RTDDHGHGTMVAATLLNIAPGCEIIGLNDTFNDAVTNLEMALDAAPDIICCSWGYDVDNQSQRELERQNPNGFMQLVEMENLITTAVQELGIPFIFAGGNGERVFPACIPEVLSIGGVYFDEDQLASASNATSSFESQLYPGRFVPDLCGISGNDFPNDGHILLPVPSGATLEGMNMPNDLMEVGWCINSASSIAAPQVAGIIALLLELDNNLSPETIRSILLSSCTPIVQGHSKMNDSPKLSTGGGLVNAFRAFETASALVSHQ